MALHALRRRPFKYSLQVAPLTLHLRVPTGERETRRAVIDFYVRADAALCGRGIRAKQRTEEDKQSGHNRPGDTPQVHPAVLLLIYNCVHNYDLITLAPIP